MSSSIHFPRLRSMESALFFYNSTFLMCLSGACCSTTPTPGVYSRLLLSIWKLWNPLCGSMTLLCKLKLKYPSLSSLSDIVRYESSFSSSYVFYSKVVKEFSIAFLILFISDLFYLLDLLDVLVIYFFSYWLLSGVSLELFRKWGAGCPVLPQLYPFLSFQSYLS